MRFVWGGIAILLALVCFGVFAQFLLNVAGADWPGVPRRLAKRPGEGSIGFLILLVGLVLLMVGVGFFGQRDPPD
jgi:protein-S-isoprenylcysteine O-methyltransferase Ste14